MSKVSNFILRASCGFVLHSCTYNISMAHTEGSATDVIDDTQSNAPDVSPELQLPISSFISEKRLASPLCYQIPLLYD